MPAATADLPYTTDELTGMGLRRDRLPRHIAIIMDGNGRWARSRGSPRIEGHRRGVQSVRNIVETCARLQLEQLTLFCFSSENWKRPPLESELLMSLLQQYVVAERKEIMRQDLQFCTIGRTDRISRRVMAEVNSTIELSRNNSGMKLCLALDYGARAEIVDACRAIAQLAASGQLEPQSIDESTISEHLNTAGMCDPDLVIRTAGEMRISNFLLWQISYAELWVTNTLWPDFRTEHLVEGLRDYASRERRFGGLNDDLAD